MPSTLPFPETQHSRVTHHTALFEEASSAQVAHKIDRDAGVIHGVKVLGRVSRRGRVYEQQALEDAVRLYEGISVAVDHPAPEDAFAPRDVGDVLGVLENCRLLEDGVYADLRLVKSHPLFEQVVERAQHMPHTLGLSHNADAGEHVRIEGGTLHIEKLVAANTVDLVTRPATNTGLFESEDPNPSNIQGSRPVKTKTVRQILEAEFGRRPVRALLEMEDAELEPVMDAQVPVEAPAEDGGEPAETSPEEQTKAAFRAMVIAAFDDPNLDTTATINRIREILKSQEKLVGGESTAQEAEGDAPEEDEDEPVQEAEGDASKKEDDEKPKQESEKLRAKLSLLEAREDARRELEHAEIPVTHARVVALANCGSDKPARKSLLEEFKQNAKTPLQEHEPFVRGGGLRYDDHAAGESSWKPGDDPAETARRLVARA